MKKTLTILLTLLIGLGLGGAAGYKYSQTKKDDTVISADRGTKTKVSIPDGEYSVKADWNWKGVTIKGDKWVTDKKKDYKLISSDNNILVLQGTNVKVLSVYKLVKENDKTYKLYSITKDGVSKEGIATLTKK
jgi:hypothetical protein